MRTFIYTKTAGVKPKLWKLGGSPTLQTLRSQWVNTKVCNFTQGLGLANISSPGLLGAFWRRTELTLAYRCFTRLNPENFKGSLHLFVPGLPLISERNSLPLGHKQKNGILRHKETMTPHLWGGIKHSGNFWHRGLSIGNISLPQNLGAAWTVCFTYVPPVGRNSGSLGLGLRALKRGAPFYDRGKRSLTMPRSATLCPFLCHM